MTATHGRAVPSREKSWPAIIVASGVAVDGHSSCANRKCDLDRIVRLRRQQIALTGGRKLRRRERYARAGAPVQCGHSRPALSQYDGPGVGLLAI